MSWRRIADRLGKYVQRVSLRVPFIPNLVVAGRFHPLVAGVLGFGGIAGLATGIAQILFLLFLILSVSRIRTGGNEHRKPPILVTFGNKGGAQSLLPEGPDQGDRGKRRRTVAKKLPDDILNQIVAGTLLNSRRSNKANTHRPTAVRTASPVTKQKATITRTTKTTAAHSPTCSHRSITISLSGSRSFVRKSTT